MVHQHLSALISNLLLLGIVGGIPLYAHIKKVDVFSELVEGGKDGIGVAVKILPYLLTFLVAIGMFRAAGGFKLMSHFLSPLLAKIGFPPDLLPMALIRPFSGSATNALLSDIAHQHGGQSFLAHAGAILMGSTETTFYVIMVYFASVGIRKMRHAVLAGLMADLAGVIAAIAVAHLFFHA